MSERNVLVFVHRYRAEQAVEFIPGPGIDRKAKGNTLLFGCCRWTAPLLSTESKIKLTGTSAWSGRTNSDHYRYGLAHS